ncbi:MAG: hypothetical protein AAF652_13640 [Cyanobacteria bacterium P01_C01_bin.72]
MNEQLSLFESVIEADSLSITNTVSEAKRQAIQRFLNHGDRDPICSVNTYSVSGSKNKYYRLSYRVGKKVNHVHIKGGNVRANLATNRAKKLQAMIDRGAELAEILAAVKDFNH